MRIIGIDLAITGQHCAALLDHEGHVLRQQIHFRTRSTELDHLLSLARQDAPEGTEIVAVMEPTGLAWLPVSSYLERQGVTVYLPGTRQVADLRKYYHKHVKGDRTDAIILAHLPLIDRQGMQPLRLPDAKHLTGQRWCKQHHRLTKLSTAIKNRIWALEHELWPGLESALGRSWRNWTNQWRRSPWYSPLRLLDSHEPEVVAALKACGAPADQALHLAQALRQAAKECLALFGEVPLIDYDDFQEQVIRELDLWAYCHQSIAQLERKIKTLYRQLHPHRFLESIPGVGEMSAAVYVFFIGDIRRFPSQARFRSWSGMIPRTAQSGDAEAKGLPITLTGPDLIKHYAYLDAEIARRHDPQIAAIYHDQMVSKGKHHKQAVCHCATHLLDRVRAALRDQRPYQLLDVDGQPISSQQAHTAIQQRYHVDASIRRRRSARTHQLGNEPGPKRRRGRPVGKKLTPKRHFTQDTPLHDETILQPN